MRARLVNAHHDSARALASTAVHRVRRGAPTPGGQRGVLHRSFALVHSPRPHVVDDWVVHGELMRCGSTYLDAHCDQPILSDRTSIVTWS